MLKPRRRIGAAVAALIVALLCAGLFSSPAVQASAPTATDGWQRVATYDMNGPTGSQPSDNDWLYQLGHSYPQAGAAPDWGTWQVEGETHSPANASYDGQGNLNITPIKAADGTWTSARLETQRTDFEAPVGGQLKVSARLRQPNPAQALGYWPAFWMLAAAARPVGAINWPSVGEIDIMEDVNGLSQVSHTFHCGVWGQLPCNEPEGISSDLLPCPGCQTDFHTYTAIIDRSLANEEIRFYTDNKLEHTVQESQVGPGIWDAAVHHGFFIILNVAIGGSYPDKVCHYCNSGATGNASSGAPMTVDYVTVEQKNGGSAPITSTSPTTSTSATPPNTTAPTTSTPTVTTTSPTTVSGSPSNLNLQQQSTSSAKLTWSGPANATYDILRGEGGDKIATVTGNAYTDGGLNLNTPYVYSVRGGGVTTPQRTITLSSTPSTTSASPTTSPSTTSPTTSTPTVTTTSPTTSSGSAVPSNPHKASGTSSTITLSWSGNAATTYEVLRGEAGDRIATVTGTSFTDIGLQAGIPYVYSIRGAGQTTTQVTLYTGQ